METKGVDPDYMVSSEAIRSGSTVISKVVMPLPKVVKSPCAYDKTFCDLGKQN